MQKKDGYRVLIVGCGELGSRHLQAVAGLPEISNIEIVDSRQEALALGKQRLDAVTDRVQHIQYRWLNSLDDATPQCDLCIIATLAMGRVALIKQVAEQLKCRSFLIEKVVSQTIAEYQDLLAFAKKSNLAIWVNCKTRAYQFHQKAKKSLVDSGPLLVSVVGGNHGLASNGIHIVDLFAFYDNATQIENIGLHIDETLHASKRGNGIFDLSGSIQGYSKKGSRLSISYVKDHQVPDHFSLVSESYRFIVDHLNRTIWESRIENNWSWEPVAFEENIMVSYMSRGFARDILISQACLLPTLEEHYPAHQFILSALEPYFSRLARSQNGVCPIT